jgi:hypothetical protein
VYGERTAATDDEDAAGAAAAEVAVDCAAGPADPDDPVHAASSSARAVITAAAPHLAGRRGLNRPPRSPPAGIVGGIRIRWCPFLESRVENPSPIPTFQAGAPFRSSDLACCDDRHAACVIVRSPRWAGRSGCTGRTEIGPLRCPAGTRSPTGQSRQGR